MKTRHNTPASRCFTPWQVAFCHQVQGRKPRPQLVQWTDPFHDLHYPLGFGYLAWTFIPMEWRNGWMPYICPTWFVHCFIESFMEYGLTCGWSTFLKSTCMSVWNLSFSKNTASHVPRNLLPSVLTMICCQYPCMAHQCWGMLRISSASPGLLQSLFLLLMCYVLPTATPRYFWNHPWRLNSPWAFHNGKCPSSFWSTLIENICKIWTVDTFVAHRTISKSV